MQPMSTATNELTRSLGLFDATMIVAGSMIGSGIFIVSADMSRVLQSPGWLLVSWLITGVLTLTAALSYGELAAMMPRAGGQYVYLRESFSPLWGFLYGWTLFLVIQTGTIAAVGVAFARYLGVLWPAVGEDRYLMAPVHLGGYAISLSTAQLVALVVIALLTWTNTRGVDYGKQIQNLFTCAKIGSLVAIFGVGLWGWNRVAAHANFTHMWTARGGTAVAPGLSAVTAFGLLVALAVSQTGSLFSADAWNNVTFTAGEIRNPRRNVALSLAFGTSMVIGLYLLANVAYLLVLPFGAVQHAPSDRVTGSMLQAVFPAIGSQLMAIGIMVSTFGCINGLVLSGARAYFAMARDGLFFRAAANLNSAHVPGAALIMQGAWSAVLVSLRTYDAGTGTFGNLYSNLLDYVISAALIFYILTITGVFLLRRRQPLADRPYRAVGYPMVPALYIVGASVILILLFAYRTSTTVPGLIIVLIGVPVYLAFRRFGSRARMPSERTGPWRPR